MYFWVKFYFSGEVSAPKNFTSSIFALIWDRTGCFLGFMTDVLELFRNGVGIVFEPMIATFGCFSRVKR